MRNVVLLLVMLSLLIVPSLAQDDDGLPIAESVCLITDLGRVNDGTFNQSAYEGMVRAVDDFDLDSRFVETQSAADYASNIGTCIEEGFDFIITIGLSLSASTYAAALENPDVYFVGVDAFFEDPLPNLVGLQFREDQAGFLAGVLAAQMTETGIVAGVYGIDYPALRRFRNGFEQGAKYINPEIDVRGVYIDDFQAPSRGASAAAQFIGEGADVIFGAAGPTGSGAIIHAASQDVWVIGVDQDEYFTTFSSGDTPGSEYLISSAIKRVDNGVYELIRRAVEGEVFTEDSVYVLEVANEGIGFAPPHEADVPVSYIDQMNEVLDLFRTGELETGVDFQTGNLLSEGEAESTPEAGE